MPKSQMKKEVNSKGDGGSAALDDRDGRTRLQSGERVHAGVRRSACLTSREQLQAASG